MTGVWIALAAVLATLAFGGYRRITDGRAQSVRRAASLDEARLGATLGSQATLVQFSTTVCAPCRATHRILSEVVAGAEGVRHVEINAENRLDLVEEFGITRTPTVLLLDAGGVIRNRIVGAARKSEVLNALQQVDRPVAA
jgi:Thiol-disulfide isomerase and thioredoxins